MRKDLWDQWESKIAIFLSIISLLFSFSTTRIGAAIDVSSKYFYGDIAQLRHGFARFIHGTDDSDAAANYDANAFINYLDYTARLFNTGEIDERFVSHVLQCHMRDLFEQAYGADKNINPARATILPKRAEIPDLAQFHDQHKGLECL
jgi:hypothetical protein